MEQAAPGARLAPQVFVWEKSAGLVPAIEMTVMDRAVPPVLVRLIGAGELVVCTVCDGNEIEVGLSETVGEAATCPVPLRVTA